MRPLFVFKGFTSTILVLAATAALPAFAQKGVHMSGGFSGAHVSAPHMAAPVSHATGMGGAPRVAPRSSAYGYSPNALTGAHAQDQGYWTSSGFVPTHSAYGQPGSGNHRRVGYGRVGYGYGVVGYPVSAYGYGGLGYGGLDFDDGDDPNNGPVEQGGNGYPGSNGYVDNSPGPGREGGYPETAYETAQDTSRIPYNPEMGSGGAFATSGDASRSNGLGHPKVTLIFKDGRQPMQVQNYAMTQTRVFVRDAGMERDIAISDLDVPATRAANDQAGVDFELPANR